MIPSRAVRLLLVALSVTSAGQALQLQPNVLRIGVADMKGLEKRQVSNTRSDTTSAPTPTSNTSNEPTNSSTRDSDTPTPTPTPTPTRSTTSRTRDSDTTTSTPTNDPDTEEPTDTDESTETTPSDMTTVLTITKTTTNDRGEEVTETSVTTSTGVLSGEGNSPSGLSTNTRNTIIGVVVGVGGAIVLCGIALVVWRIRSRRRKAEENDGLIGYGGYTAGAAEKPDSFSSPGSGSTSGRTPFQSTLESYHAPTQVNQASNF